MARPIRQRHWSPCVRCFTLWCLADDRLSRSARGIEAPTRCPGLVPRCTPPVYPRMQRVRHSPENRLRLQRSVPDIGTGLQPAFCWGKSADQSPIEFAGSIRATSFVPYFARFAKSVWNLACQNGRWWTRGGSNKIDSLIRASWLVLGAHRRSCAAG